MELRWGTVLDELEAELFGGPRIDRFTPLVARFEAEVGTLRDDDADHELLRANMVDWAACDATCPDGVASGDTWAWRAATNRIATIGSRPEYRQVASSIVGLFEVWPHRKGSWVRDRLSGILIPLAAADWTASLERTEEGPAALWEMRIVLADDGGHLCRPALEYPCELIPLLEDDWDRGFIDGHPLAIQPLRRARLSWKRSRRADWRPFFSRTRAPTR